MSLADLSSRDAVLAAIEEFDQLGRDAFLSKYGFGHSLNYVVVHDGREYDSKAIVGAAHGFEFPEEGPISNADFSGGLGEAVPKLRSLGFEVRTLHEESDDRAVADPSGDPWQWLIDHARRSFSDIAAFDSRERDYKLLVAAGIREALEAARDGMDWKARLKSALGRSYDGAHYNFSHYMQHQWVYADHPDADEEIRAVLSGFFELTVKPVDRFAAFAEVATEHADQRGAAPGAILAVGSVFNFSVEPKLLPPIKTTVYGGTGEDRVGYPRAPKDPVGAYAHHWTSPEMQRPTCRCGASPFGTTSMSRA